MLNEKSAIITGGVRGIGKAIAEEFCKNGANVLLCYRSNEEAAKQTAEELKKYGTKVELLKGDVAEPNFAAQAVQKAKEEFGRIDILVNNAGITKDKLLIKMSEEDFDSVVDTNLKGSFYFLKAVSAVMIKQKSGSIVNLSSIVGVKGNPGQVNYSASKAGVLGMTMSAAKELGRRGIRVNAIAPGYIATDMTGILTEEQTAKMNEAISLGRIGAVEDIAKTALFLASDMSSYITGQTICVDGGMSM
ncbi:3-oxoacyl-[acyl-carrier-protein] reductase [Clostridium aminobutyricum]|uniref:3-oxoacyl-[acyl-carrier-protein] reductase n=1 Tax=Clostridium aminobutyricum TaxID=33953 RepID=A0A939D8B2_CLOAM|nr:3-oxoacyl-[acyl-carrier-protein] reductase [Clostridium aminobutyricum]MBN7772996.1 3-oxoacyl-[acyl-carrier-protein] reductase [Clostridium aminobutyricum]